MAPGGSIHSGKEHRVMGKRKVREVHCARRKTWLYCVTEEILQSVALVSHEGHSPMCVGQTPVRDEQGAFQRCNRVNDTDHHGI